MTRRVRSAFGRFLALSCPSALTLLVVASSLAAQQLTGKVEGTVTGDKGAPIASAQVTIVGTSFGALTDNKGYYFINNVPIGSYTVRAKFIGYTAAEVPGVRVQGGFTLTVNVKLTQSAVAIGPVTVEAAANPIVPRDKVTSGSTVGGDLVASLPLDDVRQVLTFQPGVVESGTVAGVSIRGGRPGEANIYIDGAPVRSTNGALRNGLATVSTDRVLVAPITVGTNAVEEVSVTTGALGVEFSDAQSGVVGYTTRAGGEKLAGSFSGESDAPFGDAISVGFNRFQGSLGGPVPNVNNLRWFASAVVQGQVSSFRAKSADSIPLYVVGGVDQVVTDTGADGTVTQTVLPKFVQYSGQCGVLGSNASPIAQAIQSNYGFDCQGRRRAMDWTTLTELQGNLQYTYGTGSSVRLTGLANGTQQRFYPGTDIADPARYTGQHTWQRLAVLNWNHQVTRSSDRALSFNVNLSWGRVAAVLRARRVPVPHHGRHRPEHSDQQPGRLEGAAPEPHGPEQRAGRPPQPVRAPVRFVLHVRHAHDGDAPLGDPVQRPAGRGLAGEPVPPVHAGRRLQENGPLVLEQRAREPDLHGRLRRAPGAVRPVRRRPARPG